MCLFSQQRNSLAKAKGLGLLVLLLHCQLVFAQSSSGAETENNLVLHYQSAFSGYQSYQEQPVSSWREVNDEVEKIGGWRAYAHEASKGEADQVEVKEKPDALPASKGHRNLHGGSHE